jgi:hypothetical protein
MGRKSKLTDDQWAEAVRRVIDGESRRSVAADLGVAESSLREKISAQLKQINSVANQIVTTEQAFAALPISAQITAQNLASRLRAISDHMGAAAQYGAMTAHRLAGLAHSESSKIDDAEPMATASSMATVAALTKMANEASAIPMGLISANKEQVQRLGQPDGGNAKTLSDFYGELPEP